MSHGPDWSDSDDSLFDDDGDYDNFKVKTKSHQILYNNEPPVLTEEQKRQQDLILFSNAISSGNIEKVVEFLDQGFDANLNIRDGWTPLLLSASYGNPELTNVLINRGANVNQNRDGVTALMMACNCPDSTSPFEKSLEVIKLLVEKGANVHTINRKRMDALMYAACIGNLSALKYLVPKANMQAVDNQRWTALTWAISYNQLEVVEYLMSEGFDINLIDVRGNRPLDIAKDYGFEDIINLFPKKESDLVMEIIELSRFEFEDHFSGLGNGKKPKFFGEVCDILCGVKCSHLIPTFLEKNVTLDQFLAMNGDDLNQNGVLLPYQRNRILTGLHRIHKQPYHPKSLHVCVKKDSYSNLDIAAQVMSAVQQIIAMEASLKFILRTLERDELTKEQREMAVRSINNIKQKTTSCRMVVKELRTKFKQWDKVVEPADLITRNSMRSKFPWRKTTFCIGLISLFIICKLKK